MHAHEFAAIIRGVVNSCRQRGRQLACCEPIIAQQYLATAGIHRITLAQSRLDRFSIPCLCSSPQCLP